MTRRAQTGLPITILPLSEKDIPQLVSILYQHVRNRFTGETALDEIEQIQNYMKGLPDHHGRTRKYLVAHHKDGKTFGCMAYAPPDPLMLQHFHTNPYESSQLCNAFVAQEVYRGNGIGKELFEAICKEVAEEGKKYLLIDSGHRYKKSWGFYDKVCTRSGGFLPHKYAPNYGAMTWIKYLYVQDIYQYNSSYAHLGRPSSSTLS